MMTSSSTNIPVAVGALNPAGTYCALLPIGVFQMLVCAKGQSSAFRHAGRVAPSESGASVPASCGPIVPPLLEPELLPLLEPEPFPPLDPELLPPLDPELLAPLDPELPPLDPDALASPPSSPVLDPSPEVEEHPAGDAPARRATASPHTSFARRTRRPNEHFEVTTACSLSIVSLPSVCETDADHC
jgi:hypothetical protein